MRRGEVWWAESPDAGRRPVLIVTRNEALPVLKRVVCAPATTKIRGLATELPADEDDGMPRECAFSFDNLETIAQSLLTSRICRLRPDREHEICDKLAAAFGC